MRLAERREGGREGGEDEKQLQQVLGQGRSNKDPSVHDDPSNAPFDGPIEWPLRHLEGLLVELIAIDVSSLLP
ncbi:2-dehydro-3-deoxyphosphooctonate aldolase 1 [Pyrus ussuriensis x Pyrus communis]|uniref:2-dehydro-3-deoxyphosphooctonate aldolase 1 n=1 Tax=Pyrus ussuriensis x Pyrus communis TaxID=2448454 RepID=A0A5N5HFT4_9ROSA|nr:2-dehydro-3-deoxyphosphooctonate aldolase 1 [Pyrus ussuriensis x Pyrus communis]